MNFGQALEALRAGNMVARSGWNGKRMFIFMQMGNTMPKQFIHTAKSIPDLVKEKLANLGVDVVFKDNITMYNAAGELQPGWNASTPDMLAHDWTIVD